MISIRSSQYGNHDIVSYENPIRVNNGSRVRAIYVGDKLVYPKPLTLADYKYQLNIVMEFNGFRKHRFMYRRHGVGDSGYGLSYDAGSGLVQIDMRSVFPWFVLHESAEYGKYFLLSPSQGYSRYLSSVEGSNVAVPRDAIARYLDSCLGFINYSEHWEGFGYSRDWGWGYANEGYCDVSSSGRFASETIIDGEQALTFLSKSNPRTFSSFCTINEKQTDGYRRYETWGGDGGGKIVMPGRNEMFSFTPADTLHALGHKLYNELNSTSQSNILLSGNDIINLPRLFPYTFGPLFKINSYNPTTGAQQSKSVETNCLFDGILQVGYEGMEDLSFQEPDEQYYDISMTRSKTQCVTAIVKNTSGFDDLESYCRFFKEWELRL